ncbi:hypothetical protein [Variovorax sp. UMC13]|uniref:hypothetical protein n=1 Tax=Variovorax sp. UMC13 TaxID=1862326 RepID=UPI0016049BE6|nr:hypothetical protein [Variovorax sp. UMC13]
MYLVPTSSAALRSARLPRSAALVLAKLAALHGGAGRARSRGELLYDTNCIGCHNNKVHWRAAKLATDWNSLEAQVRRWQQAASLGWRDEDVAEVAGYLNERFYGFTPTNTTGLLKSSAPAPFAAGLNSAAPPDRP